MSVFIVTVSLPGYLFRFTLKTHPYPRILKQSGPDSEMNAEGLVCSDLDCYTSISTAFAAEFDLVFRIEMKINFH